MMPRSRSTVFAFLAIFACASSGESQDPIRVPHAADGPKAAPASHGDRLAGAAWPFHTELRVPVAPQQ
jgi:hypothetical protein